MRDDGWGDHRRREAALSRIADLVAPARLGRDFRWLLASNWVTNLGDGITLAAGPLLVASQTRNPLAVAMATFLQRLPWLMFGLYAGVLADRVSRRAIVIVTGLVRVTILVLLIASILTRRVDTAVVLAALFLFGVNETFGETASTTVLPMLVAAGMALPFVSEAVCVLAGVLLIARIRLPAPGKPAQRARVREDIREGWRWL